MKKATIKDWLATHYCEISAITGAILGVLCAQIQNQQLQTACNIARTLLAGMAGGDASP